MWRPHDVPPGQVSACAGCRAWDRRSGVCSESDRQSSVAGGDFPLVDLLPVLDHDGGAMLRGRRADVSGVGHEPVAHFPAGCVRRLDDQMLLIVENLHSVRNRAETPAVPSAGRRRSTSFPCRESLDWLSVG